MMDLERIRTRERKNAEERYGISLVWFPDEGIPDLIGRCVADLETMLPACLIPYPVVHASRFRCRSVAMPIAPVVGLRTLRAAEKYLLEFKKLFNELDAINT
jgi:hypothetical protein